MGSEAFLACVICLGGFSFFSCFAVGWGASGPFYKLNEDVRIIFSLCSLFDIAPLILQFSAVFYWTIYIFFLHLTLRCNRSWDTIPLFSKLQAFSLISILFKLLPVCLESAYHRLLSHSSSLGTASNSLSSSAPIRSALPRQCEVSEKSPTSHYSRSSPISKLLRVTV
jgi:hypothetical protein